VVEAIWPAIQADVDLRVYYGKRLGEKRANIVKVATARRLATIIYCVLYQKRWYYRVYGSRLL